MLQKLKLIFIPCKENKYKPSFFKSKFLAFIVLILFIFKLILISFIWYFPKSALFAEINKNVLLNLTNEERQSFNLVPLKENSKLDEAAYLKAQDMLQNDYFAHTSPTGISPWYWFDLVGYNYHYAGENLAIDFIDSEEVHKAWISSSTHRENIINPNYQDIGIAVVTGEFQGRETTIVVQFFGSPMPPLASSAPTEVKAQAPQESINNNQISQNSPTSQNISVSPQKSSNSGQTLYDYYLKKGEKFPSLKERAILFEEYGLGPASSYRGTAEQNTALLNKLLQNPKKEIIQNKSSKEETNLEQKTAPSLPVAPQTEEKISESSQNFSEPPKETIQPQENKEENISEITQNSIQEKKELTPQEKELLEEARKEQTKTPLFPSDEIKQREAEKNSFKFKLLNFMVENYDRITQQIFLVVLILVIISFCLNVFLKIDTQAEDLILLGVFYIFVLLALFLFDKDLILEMIPHNVGIL